MARAFLGASLAHCEAHPALPPGEGAFLERPPGALLEALTWALSPPSRSRPPAFCLLSPSATIRLRLRLRAAKFPSRLERTAGEGGYDSARDGKQPSRQSWGSRACRLPALPLRAALAR